MGETAPGASELLDVDVQREMAPHGGDGTHFSGGETGSRRGKVATWTTDSGNSPRLWVKPPSVPGMTQDLSSRLTTGPYWQLVRPALAPGETQVHYTHLKKVNGAEETSGTLFLTSSRLLWRSVDPRDPEGSGFEMTLGDVIGVDQPARFAAFHAFRVVVEEDARPVDTFFFPQVRNDVERHLCAQMFGYLDAAWKQHRALVASA